MSGAGDTWREGIEVLSFDLFDTLIDLDFAALPRTARDSSGRPSTAGLVYEAAQPALAAASADRGFEAFAETLAASDKQLYREYQGTGRELATPRRFELAAEALGIPAAQRASLAEAWTDVHMGALRSTTCTPVHHVEALRTLAQRYRLVLCSNFTHSRTALGLLEDAGLHAYFEHCVVSDAVGWRKPRAEIFAAVTACMDVAPERVLHIGDNLVADIGGASAAGMRTAWLTRRVADREAALERAPETRADLEIADIADLAERLAP